MKNSELKQRLQRLTAGLEPIANHESKFRRLVEDSGGFDMLVSMDIFNIEHIYSFLKKQEKNEFKYILNGRMTLEDFSTKDKLKSILKDFTKPFRKKNKYGPSFKEHVTWFFNDIKHSLSLKGKCALGFIITIYILMLGIFIFSFFGGNIILASIGTIVSLAFIILHFKFLYDKVIWKEL